MDILHSISKDRITPDSFLACIEIPAGCKNKYELDHESGALILDRILYTSTHYPQNYGFIPRTWSTDNDPLDVLVICSEPIVPMAITMCYPIGILEMNDSGTLDEKIISICAHDPLYNSFKDIKELPQHILDEIMHFFKVYKELEHGKKTVIDRIYGVDKAKDAIRKARARYDELFTQYK